MATKYDFHKIIIGRSELLDFVDLDAHKVPAKTDTGAYRSAIHAANIKEDEDKNQLTFTLFGGHPVCGAMAQRLTVTDYNKVWVENSFGHRQERFEIALKVKLGPKIFKARFTLADRSKKIYPILLGRTLINHRFLVDTARSGVDRASLKKLYEIDFPNDEEEGR